MNKCSISYPGIEDWTILTFADFLTETALSPQLFQLFISLALPLFGFVDSSGWQIKVTSPMNAKMESGNYDCAIRPV